MGGYLNIEIHQKLASAELFILKLKMLLSLGMDDDSKTEFISSIQLKKESTDAWFEYKLSNIRFNSFNSIKNIDFGIYLYYYEIFEYQYVIEFSILESDIQIYTEDKPYFDELKTQDLIKLMEQIHQLLPESVILFTDEVSQQMFFDRRMDMNFLFDLAIIPNEIKWDFDPLKYKKLKDLNTDHVWSSKSMYMRKYLELLTRHD